MVTCMTIGSQNAHGRKWWLCRLVTWASHSLCVPFFRTFFFFFLPWSSTELPTSCSFPFFCFLHLFLPAIIEQNIPREKTKKNSNQDYKKSWQQRRYGNMHVERGGKAFSNWFPILFVFPFSFSTLTDFSSFFTRNTWCVYVKENEKKRNDVSVYRVTRSVALRSNWKENGVGRNNMLFPPTICICCVKLNKRSLTSRKTKNKMIEIESKLLAIFRFFLSFSLQVLLTGCCCGNLPGWRRSSIKKNTERKEKKKTCEEGK